MTKLYQEDADSSFTHDGKTYLLNPILAKANKLPAVSLDLKELEWLVDDSVEEDNDRIEKADYQFPILVTRYKNKWVTIDGWHRFLKARRDGLKTIQVKKIPTAWFNKENETVLTLFK